MNQFRKVVIVDDESTSNYISSRILKLTQSFGIIQCFESPLKALEYLQDIYLNDKYDEIPELILVDINMPEMDGWQFIEEFNKIPVEKTLKTSINMLSSSNHEKDLRRFSLLKRVAHYFVKPLTLEHVKKMSGNNKPIL